MYRAGIIGCGFIGVEAPDNHARAYGDCENTELVSVSDKDLFRTLPPRTPVILERYTAYLEMVQVHSLDIISVCTPPETHKQIVCDIAPYVKAIYCEKPIALTLEDADDMIKTCRKNKTILQINHQRRFILPKIKFSRGIINNGTHMFDLLRKLFGEITQITVNRVYFNGSGLPACDIEYCDTEEFAPGLDVQQNQEMMIGKGVQAIVYSLEFGVPSPSSGESGREALRLALEFEKLWKGNEKLQTPRDK